MKLKILQVFFLVFFLAFSTTSLFSAPSNDCEVNGGQLFIGKSYTAKKVCKGDGQSDPVNVSITNQNGENSSWLLTDNRGNILAYLDGPNVDFEELDFDLKVIYVWHLSYNGVIYGAEIGANANNISGCFAFSNPIIVRIVTTGLLCAEVDVEEEDDQTEMTTKEITMMMTKTETMTKGIIMTTKMETLTVILVQIYPLILYVVLMAMNTLMLAMQMQQALLILQVHVW